MALLGGELPGGYIPDLLLAEAGPLEDARDAGVGVLHVEDGVLVRLLYGQLQVEVDLAPVRGPHVEVPCHVLPHLVQELIQRDDVAGPPAELDLLPLAHELDGPPAAGPAQRL